MCNTDWGGWHWSRDIFCCCQSVWCSWSTHYLGACGCATNQNTRWTCDRTWGCHTINGEKQDWTQRYVSGVSSISLNYYWPPHTSGPLETQIGKGAVSLNLTLRRYSHSSIVYGDPSLWIGVCVCVQSIQLVCQCASMSVSWRLQDRLWQCWPGHHQRKYWGRVQWYRTWGELHSLTHSPTHNLPSLPPLI